MALETHPQPTSIRRMVAHPRRLPHQHHRALPSRTSRKARLHPLQHHLRSRLRLRHRRILAWLTQPGLLVLRRVARLI